MNPPVSIVFRGPAAALLALSLLVPWLPRDAWGGSFDPRTGSVWRGGAHAFSRSDARQRGRAISEQLAAFSARKNFEALAENGLLGLLVPKELGGMGENHVAAAMVAETIARYGCASTAMWAPSVE